ncbi:MAG: DnaJ domain-containing protein [Deltaproteobacteria bacterium]|nr:DnaJ domain-containing protein [Deltaproteobacteria bacterium]
MSTVPAEIAGIGPTSLKLRVSPGFDPLKAAVGPDEYFLLSRIDGNQTIRSVLLDSGLPIERGIAIVTRLRSIGALLLPGESAAPAPASMPSSMAAPRTAPAPPPRAAAQGTKPTTQHSLGHDLRLANPTPEEVAALAEDSELDDTERRMILTLERLLAKNDPYMLIGVSQGADAKTLKRAYFLLSKEIHPDRYYGMKLGSFAARTSRVFEEVSRAYARLTSPASTRGSGSHQAVRVPTQDQPQTPQAYAAELFDRACQLEVGGDALNAMKLFAACVRMDPQIKYLRRATSCALAAGQPRTAVEYAQKAYLLAPNDVSSARLLATAFRHAGKLSEAEEVLVMAMALKSENDVLTAELRHDLAEVRRMLANP